MPVGKAIFTDDPLNTGTVAVIEHIVQLRTAVNALRTAAGLGVQVFADTPLTRGTPIRPTRDPAPHRAE